MHRVVKLDEAVHFDFKGVFGVNKKIYESYCQGFRLFVVTDFSKTKQWHQQQVESLYRAIGLFNGCWKFFDAVLLLHEQLKKVNCGLSFGLFSETLEHSCLEGGKSLSVLLLIAKIVTNRSSKVYSDVGLLTRAIFAVEVCGNATEGSRKLVNKEGSNLGELRSLFFVALSVEVHFLI